MTHKLEVIVNCYRDLYFRNETYIANTSVNEILELRDETLSALERLFLFDDPTYESLQDYHKASEWCKLVFGTDAYRQRHFIEVLRHIPLEVRTEISHMELLLLLPHHPSSREEIAMHMKEIVTICQVSVSRYLSLLWIYLILS